MRRRANRSMVLWLACLMLPGVGARAAEPDAAASNARQAVHEAFVIDRARAALAVGEPRRAMVAAILYPDRRGAQSEEQIQGDAAAPARRAELDRLVGESIALALALGADDALVQVFLASSCDQPWANCDADAALERLAELDPDNGLAALMVLDRAHRRQQAGEEREAFEAFAKAERLTTLEGETPVAVRDFIGNADLPAAMLEGAPEGLTAEDQRAVIVIGSWLARQRPGFSISAESARCRAEPLGADDRERCVAAARVLAGSDDAISPRIGLRLLEDLADDPEEQALVRSRQRDLDWQTSAFGELTREVGATPGSVVGYLDAMIATGGERALMEKRLSDAGLPLTAPADWVPTDPRLSD